MPPPGPARLRLSSRAESIGPPASRQHTGGLIPASTGSSQRLADRWHTCFFDLSGGQGLLGQAEGRTADDAAYWLAR
jgi:transposase